MFTVKDRLLTYSRLREASTTTVRQHVSHSVKGKVFNVKQHEREIPGRADLIKKFNALKFRRDFTGLYRSDTAVELTAPLRYSSERAEEFARIEAASGTTEAIRSMDSIKKWGLGWAAAIDEWEAASSLGGSDSWPKAARDELKHLAEMERKPLSAIDLAAFKARREISQAKLKLEHPDGEVTVYRGIRGAQAKKLAGVDSGEVDLGVHALSSWSLYPSTAREFIGKGSKRGRILSTRVKLSEIWSTGEDARDGALLKIVDQNGEIVVLSEDKTRRVSIAD